jgi:ribonuclease-3
VAAPTDRAPDAFAGHVFSTPSLLAQALTHRSAGAPHNERLEFLGDAVLGLIVAEALYARWPKADEGSLTRARAELVRESALAAVARRLELGEQLVLGPGEMKSGGHRRDSILSDALEACRRVVLPWFEEAVSAVPASKVGKDAKTRLQEWLQARQKPLPQYVLEQEAGEEHARVFTVRCVLSDPALEGEGSGGSRRAAEQMAAEAVLGRLPGQ